MVSVVRPPLLPLWPWSPSCVEVSSRPVLAMGILGTTSGMPPLDTPPAAVLLCTKSVDPGSLWPDSSCWDGSELFVVVVSGLAPSRLGRKPPSGLISDQYRGASVLGCVCTTTATSAGCW